MTEIIKVVSMSMELRYFSTNIKIRMPRVKEIKVLSCDKKNGMIAS